MANLIKNGTFDNGSRDFWGYSARTYFAINAGADTGATGDGCAVFQNEGVGGAREIIQMVQSGIVPGRTYTLSFYAKRFNRYDAWAGYGHWNKAGTQYTFRDLPSLESQLVHDRYVKLTYQITVPTDAQTVLWIHIKGGADAINGWSTLQVDNIVLDDGQGGGGGGIGPYYNENRYLSDYERSVNAQTILNYLRGKGWTKQAVCGMLGNFDVECRINPGAWRNYQPPPNDSVSFGLPQWTPARNYINNWANPQGYSPDDLQGQLECFEANTKSNLWGQYIARAPYAGISFAAYKVSTQTADYLARVFENNYERSGTAVNERATRATYWFNNLT